jgi:predicted site-specific integrase-resolvase
MMGAQGNDYLRMKVLSTSQVARQAGVHPGTLERWLSTGKLRWPKVLIEGGRIMRLWKQADIEHIQRYKAKHCGKARRRQNHRAPFDADVRIV